MIFKPVKQINWMELSGLLVGVFFTVAVTIFGIVLYTKLFASGMIGVEEYSLHSTFEKALGLRPGTRVQINGVDVGQISDMEIEGDGVHMDSSSASSSRAGLPTAHRSTPSATRT